MNQEEKFGGTEPKTEAELLRYMDITFLKRGVDNTVAICDMVEGIEILKEQGIDVDLEKVATSYSSLMNIRKITAAQQLRIIRPSWFEQLQEQKNMRIHSPFEPHLLRLLADILD